MVWVLGLEFVSLKILGGAELWSQISKVSAKRDLLQCQKRPNTVSNEAYYSVKRGVSSQISKASALEHLLYDATREQTFRV
jgi:hypothetical protein